MVLFPCQGIPGTCPGPHQFNLDFDFSGISRLLDVGINHLRGISKSRLDIPFKGKYVSD